MAYRNRESTTLRINHAITRRQPKPRRRFPPEVLTPIDFTTMLDACSSRPTGIRNRAMLVTLCRAGLPIT
jgi:site-specific recombinase XerD